MGVLAAALRRELAGEVRDDAYTRHLFAADASLYALEPLAVAFPRDVDDVAAAMGVCARLGVPIVARGAGTSLAGQSRWARARARHLAPNDGDRRGRGPHGAGAARGRPGGPQSRRQAPWPRLRARTRRRRTGRRSAGMIGNNSSGSESIVYGTTIDHVLSLDVVLADGSRATFAEGAAHRLRRTASAPPCARTRRAIEHDYPKHWRQSGGYRLDRLDPFNLAKLIVGSEGTLALVTSAVVKLVELPKAKMFAVGHFESVAQAIAATEPALALGPIAVEMIDRKILSLSRSKLEYRQLADRLEGDPGALLFVSFAGDSDDEVRAKLDALEWDAYHTIRAETAADQGDLTKVRKAGLGLLMAASEGRQQPAAFVEDTAVAPERLRRVHRAVPEILARHGLERRLLRALLGRLPARAAVRRRVHGTETSARPVAARSPSSCVKFDGVTCPASTATGGCAPVSARRCSAPSSTARSARSRACSTRTTCSTPARWSTPEPLTAHLRDADLPQPKVLQTDFRFPEGSLHAAADRCQRVGECRKTGSGVMCPSYMATREEEHATRGRANALVEGAHEPDPAAPRRRAPARRPRPLPRVQGVQERVPDERRHGDAQGGVPLAAQRHPRDAVAFAAVRLDPDDQPPRLGVRAAVEPACAGGAVGSRVQAPAAALRARDTDPLGQAARQALRHTGDLPRRLLHDVHRAGRRPCVDRAARGRRLRRAAGVRGLLRAGSDLEGVVGRRES